MESKESRFGWLVSIGQWLAWLATSAGVIVTAIYIREGLLDFLGRYGVMRLEEYSENGVIAKRLEVRTELTAVDFFTIFFLACLAVWAIVWIEYYFRKGRAKGLLWKRVLRVAGVEAAIILGSILLRILIPT